MGWITDIVAQLIGQGQGIAVRQQVHTIRIQQNGVFQKPGIIVPGSALVHQIQAAGGLGIGDLLGLLGVRQFIAVRRHGDGVGEGAYLMVLSVLGCFQQSVADLAGVDHIELALSLEVAGRRTALRHGDCQGEGLLAIIAGCH